MAIKLGKPKHQGKTTLKDILDHPIWVNTYEEAGDYDEECIRPVVAASPKVSSELLRKYFSAIVTFQIEGADLYGQGMIAHHDRSRLHSLAVLKGRKWRSLPTIKGLKTPVTLLALPKISGKKNMRFVVHDLKAGVATSDG